MTTSPEPTRRDQLATTIYVAWLPPRGEPRVSQFGAGVALLAVVLSLSLLATALGEPTLIPSVMGLAGLLYVLYVMFDFFGGV